MSDAWVGVIGAAIGGVIAVSGQWIVQRRVDGGTRRRERRSAYIDFIDACNHGMRIATALRQTGTELARMRTTLEVAHGEVAQIRENVVQSTRERLNVTQQTVKTLEGRQARYLRAMDRTLGAFQITAPTMVLSAGEDLRKGLTDYTEGRSEYPDLEALYKRFVLLSRIDLDGPLNTGWRRLVPRLLWQKVIDQWAEETRAPA